MQEMIYYPGFEVKDENWLKFALLYFDNLKPIIPDIPYQESMYLSDTCLEIMNETNLIQPYRPDYTEGYHASILACKQFEYYFEFPERYAGLFGYRNSRYNFVEKWKNPVYQIYTLFNGKYSDFFYDYCIQNKIASRCNEGICISEDLAFAYMSFLADIISKNNEFEMITDIQKYSEFLLQNNKNLSIIKIYQ